MPLYDFKCKKCNTVFEVFKFKYDEEKPVCPNCNTNEYITMVYGKTGVIFNASGFYETDYKRKDNKNIAD